MHLMGGDVAGRPPSLCRDHAEVSSLGVWEHGQGTLYMLYADLSVVIHLLGAGQPQ